MKPVTWGWLSVRSMLEVAAVLGDARADMDVAGRRDHRRRGTPRPRRRHPSSSAMMART